MLVLAGALFLAPSTTTQGVTDQLSVTGFVSITSRLGQETIALTGTAVVDHGVPYLDGGVLVMDTEIVSMTLTGDSATGPVTVVESNSLTSGGEIRGMQASPQQYPASTDFDVYIIATVPASPNPTIDLHNDIPIHLTGQPVYGWPTGSVTYTAQPGPCIPLLPSLPAQACLNSMSFTALGPAGVGGAARLAAPFVGGAQDSGAKGSAYAALAVVAVALVAWQNRRLVRRVRPR